MGEFFPALSDFINSFPNLTDINVSGMRIGDHLGDLVPAFKNAKTKSLSLELNGIEPESCLYLNFIINFDHLMELNLNNNWIGINGIERLKDNFRLFK
jgi:hypothetical protein